MISPATLPAGIGGTDNSRERVSILGIPVDNVTLAEAVELVVGLLDSPRPRQVMFVNAHCFNVATRDPGYLALLREDNVTFGDGVGLRIAGWALRLPLRQNVNGTDLFEPLCAAMASNARSVFLLGGLPGVAERVRDWLAQNHPMVQVSGCRNGYFRPEDEEELVHQIATSGARLLLVALGVPRQELWIARHLPRLGVGVAMGVGGLFDFYSGRVPRAPRWLRALGGEWVYRMYKEPRRLWRRYLLGNPEFLLRLAREVWIARGLRQGSTR